jgi:hypothetical protein
MDQRDSFTYLGVTITKDGGCNENVKEEKPRPRGFYKNEIYLEE